MTETYGAGFVDPASLRAFVIGGEFLPVFRSSCLVETGRLMENIKSALSRGLPEAKRCRPHKHVLNIAGGGPSMADTYKDLDGYIGAVNGSARFLSERGVLPDACLLLDPLPELIAQVHPDPRLRWFVASQCDPVVFNHLKGCHVELWHASGPAGLDEVLPTDRMKIPGGITCSLRWLTLGYALGFRHFKLHGMDSSYRNDAHHAYEAKADDGLPTMEVNGYRTRSDMVGQVNSFLTMLRAFNEPDVEPVKIEVFGDGLLQHHWAEYQKRHPGAFSMMENS